MARYSIPNEAIRGLSIINTTPQNQLDKVIKELKNAPKGRLPSQHVDNFIKITPWNREQIKNVIEVLFNLYRIKEREEKSAQEIAKDIYLSLSEMNLDELQPTDKLESNLLQLLSIRNLGITIKALQLSTEYEKTFSGCRILTDVRFAFDKDIESKVDTAVVVHNLQIEYRDAHENKEIFIALGIEDIRDLKNQLTRAEKKEQTIKLSLKDKVFFIDLIE